MEIGGMCDHREQRPWPSNRAETCSSIQFLPASLLESLDAETSQPVCDYIFRGVPPRVLYKPI